MPKDLSIFIGYTFFYLCLSSSKGAAICWSCCWTWWYCSGAAASQKFGCCPELSSFATVGHTPCFCHFLPSDAVGKAPNQLRMVVDRPNRDEMVRYRGARNYQILHRSAAKLWSHGVQMGTALKIIREAVAESGG